MPITPVVRVKVVMADGCRSPALNHYSTCTSLASTLNTASQISRTVWYTIKNVNSSWLIKPWVCFLSVCGACVLMSWCEDMKVWMVLVLWLLKRLFRWLFTSKELRRPVFSERLGDWRQHTTGTWYSILSIFSVGGRSVKGSTCTAGVQAPRKPSSNKVHLNASRAPKRRLFA